MGLSGTAGPQQRGLKTTLTDEPEVVAQVILTAATDPDPKRRYAAGKLARQVSLLRRFVPMSAIDKSLRKQLGLPV